jgi:CheY-like chemotaxis protein
MTPVAKIMIVEDHEIIANLITPMLEKGYYSQRRYFPGTTA